MVSMVSTGRPRVVVREAASRCGAYVEVRTPSDRCGRRPRCRAPIVMDATRVRLVDVAAAAVVAVTLLVVMAGIEPAASTRSFDALAAVLVVAWGRAVALV